MFLGASLKLTRSFISNQTQQSPLPPKMPPLALHGVGNLVVFQNTIEGIKKKDMKMFKVEENIVKRAAWVNLTVHFMHKYMEFIAATPALRVGLT